MLAKRFGHAIADSLRLLGIQRSYDEVVNEVEHHLTQPIDFFVKHPNWPSGLGIGGIPIELSTTVESDGSSSFRFTFDAADHRQGLGWNWNCYWDSARSVTNISNSNIPRLRHLFVNHLDGMAELVRTPLIHGVGYGPHLQKRGSLYFFTYWLSYSSLLSLFPEHADIFAMIARDSEKNPSERLQCISYDFVEGENNRTKFYQILEYKKETELFKSLSQNQDLGAVDRLIQNLYSQGSSSKIADHRVFHVLSSKKKELTSDIRFPCPNWGWENPAGYLEIISRLTTIFSLDLTQLYMVLNVFSSYGIKLKPSFIKIGGPEHKPFFGFYFCPELEQEINGNIGRDGLPSAKTDILSTIDQMLSSALGFIMTKRERYGNWSDFNISGDKSDEWVTAFITSALSHIHNIHQQLDPSMKWLGERYRPGKGWGYNIDSPTDAESTALALLAFKNMNLPLPGGSGAALLNYRLPRGGYLRSMESDLDEENGYGAIDITALVILAQIENGLLENGLIRESVASMISQQRYDGGWNSFWWRDDIVATYRAVQALTAFTQFANKKIDKQLPSDMVQSVAKSVIHARASTSAQAIPDEPFVLGVWLGSWASTGGSALYPSVHRIVSHLRSLQQQDGRWLSVPVRRIALTKLLRPWARSDSGRLYMDQECLITTAMTIEGLNSLREVINRGQVF